MPIASHFTSILDISGDLTLRVHFLPEYYLHESKHVAHNIIHYRIEVSSDDTITAGTLRRHKFTCLISGQYVSLLRTSQE
jgi:hypothetical protein